MPPRPLLDLQRFTIPEALSLVVVWRRGRALDAGELRAGEDVGEFLRVACERTLSDLREREEQRYSADMHLAEEEYLLLEDEELVAAAPLAQLLLATQPLPVLAARSLPPRLLLYAVTLRAAGGEMIAFVRKSNPRTSVRPGRILATLGNALTRLDRPVLQLDAAFDLIVTPRGIIALNQRVFETLFKDTEAVLELVPQWVEQIAAHLPMSTDGAAWLAERCRTDSRLRHRLRAISERGHLRTVSLTDLHRHLQELGLPEQQFVKDNQLVIDQADPFTLMALLNEDLFAGGLTGTGFRSDRKTPR